MIIKKLLLLFGPLVLVIGLSFVSDPPLPLYKNKNAPLEDRVNDLLKRMTLEEKILQLNQYPLGLNTNVNNIEKQVLELNPLVGSFIYLNENPVSRNAVQKKAVEGTRLGIPIIFGYDVIHGFKTIYPIPLAVACSWNIDLQREACAMAAKEARLSGVDWTFSPMVDVARDPRWGRVAEGYGEDPYVNAVFGVAAVKGYQGNKLTDPNSIAACLKHYVGYGMSEGGRDYRYSDVSSQSLWETYMVPFKAGVDAGVATLMSAFNDISGVPASANYYTLTEVLKNKWKHKGFVVSDWDSIDQLIAQGVAKDRKEAAQKAIMAGVDMDMGDNIYQEELKQLIKEGKVSLSRIDDAAKRILRLKFSMGLFEHPYTTIVPEDQRYLQPNSLSLATAIAEESMVLLKNSDHILPISSSVKSIAIIGPLAKDSFHQLGTWSGHGDAKDAKSIFDGITTEFKGRASVSYAQGCDFDGADTSSFNAAIKLAHASDIIVLCLGEKREWTGESASRSTIALPQLQERLFNSLVRTGKPVVVVLSNGRPLELVRIEPKANAILEAWQSGTMAGSAVAGILSGRINPSGKLAITFPLTTGQIPTYYNMRQSARPYKAMGDYQDIPTSPLYWFGHGLSYTDFLYGDVKLSSNKITKKQSLTVTMEVENTGAVDGKETVLWYIADPVASISRPMKELKFFEKKLIKSGAKAIYSFIIDPVKDLGYIDSKGNSIVEPGDFYLMVGDKKIKFELLQ